MRALASFTTLTYLDLSHCEKVSAEGVRALAPLTVPKETTVVCSCGWGFIYCVFRLLFVSPSL
jgi:hypothetical protein